MNYHIIPVTPFAQNCSLVWCPVTQQAALIDPGGDAQRIKQAITETGVKVTQILLTHGHLDHVGAAAELAAFLHVPIIGPQKEDEFWPSTAEPDVRAWRVSAFNTRSVARRGGQRDGWRDDISGAAVPRPYTRSYCLF